MINTKRKITYTLLCAAVAVLIAIAAFVFTGIGVRTTKASAEEYPTLYSSGDGIKQISAIELSFPAHNAYQTAIVLSKAPFDFTNHSFGDFSSNALVKTYRYDGSEPFPSTFNVTCFDDLEYNVEYNVYALEPDHYGSGYMVEVFPSIKCTFYDRSTYPAGLTLEYDTLVYKYVPDLPQALQYQICVAKGHWDLPNDSSKMRGIGSIFSCWQDEVVTFSLSEYLGNTIELGYEYTISIYYINNMSMKFVVPDCVVYATFGDVVPLPDDPVKEGYHFIGWYYDEAFTIPYAGEPLLADTPLYARFEIDTFTVSYDVAGGTKVESVIVDWNTAAPAAETTRIGYDFVGWFTANGDEYDGYGIKADTLLTARWEIKIFTVTFYTGDEVFRSIEVEYGTRLVDAMDKAKLATWAVCDAENVRVSKVNSVITDNTEVLVRELSRTEKIGEYVGSHAWTIYATAAIIGVLFFVLVVSITVAVKRK